MNCTEALATLSTASLRDMTPDSAVMLHCDTCPDCARVTTLLRDREYDAATVLNGLPPMSNPITVAEQSVITSRRRRLGRVAVLASGAALVVTIWIAASLTIIPALNVADARRVTRLGTETISMTCLSHRQAAGLLGRLINETSKGEPHDVLQKRNAVSRCDAGRGRDRDRRRSHLVVGAARPG